MTEQEIDKHAAQLSTVIYVAKEVLKKGPDNISPEEVETSIRRLALQLGVHSEFISDVVSLVLDAMLILAVADLSKQGNVTVIRVAKSKFTASKN